MALPARRDEPCDALDGPPGLNAFEAFFRAHYPSVQRLARGVLGEPQAAQDVAQEVFLAAYRRFGGEWEERAAGWVRVAAVHTALNVLRGERRRDRRHSLVRPEGVPASLEETVIDRETRAEVRRCLARLPRRSAAVLVMRHGGMSYVEIAQALGVKVGHVGTMLRRAEDRMRKELDRETHR